MVSSLNINQMILGSDWSVQLFVIICLYTELTTKLVGNLLSELTKVRVDISTCKDWIFRTRDSNSSILRSLLWDLRLPESSNDFLVAVLSATATSYFCKWPRDITRNSVFLNSDIIGDIRRRCDNSTMYQVTWFYYAVMYSVKDIVNQNVLLAVKTL